MASKYLIDIFMDSQHIIANSTVLQNQMNNCKARSILYLEDYVSSIRKEKGSMKIEVLEATTFQCARDVLHTGSKIAVLNFANPHEPGGGVIRGAMAQEECLCRCSDLYNALNQPYFLKHYYQYHYHNCDYLFSDRIIYSPKVTVIKSDDKIPQLLENPFLVDVITCAAPYLSDWIEKSNDELLGVYKSRIRNILEVAMSKDVDILILGAFGCGAFNNDPQLMSKAFAELLIQEQYAKFFVKVLFAIKRSGAFCPNLCAFEKAFGGSV